MKTIFVTAICCLVLAATAIADDRQSPKPSPSDKSSKLAKEMRAGIASFRLDVTFYGTLVKQQHPYYRLTLSMQPVEQLAKDPFHAIALIKEAEAQTIIGWLGSSGFLDRSIDDMSQDITPRAPKGPTYWLTVGYELPNAGQGKRHEDLGWNLQMLQRLDALKAVLGKESAGAMDLLLERMADDRRGWETE